MMKGAEDEKKKGQTDSLPLGRGHSFARKLIKTLFSGCFFVFSGASSHLLDYLETTWRKKATQTHMYKCSPPTHSRRREHLTLEN